MISIKTHDHELQGQGKSVLCFKASYLHVYHPLLYVAIPIAITY